MIRFPQIASTSLLLAAALLAAACSDVQPQRPTGEVLGKVTLKGLDDSSGIVVSLAGPRSASATTDAKGAYQVESLPPGQYTLRASAADVLEQALETQVTVAQDARVIAAPLELTPTGRVQGRVTLGAETGNAGITVVVSGAGTSKTTGDDGTFLLERVPVGAHDVVAFYPGRQTASWTKVAVVRGQEAELPPATLALVSPAPGLVRGRVRLGTEPAPAGILVTATGPISQGTVTDAQGSYRLQGLPDGQYVVTIVAPSTAEGSTSFPVAIQGGAVDAADVLFTAQGALSGTVALEGMESGSQAGVLVSVNGTPAAALTDDTGAFVLRGVPAGKRVVTLSRAGWDTLQKSDVQVAWGQTTALGKSTLLRSRPLPGGISGKIVLTGETVHAGVLVTLTGPVSQSQLTDDAGSFTFSRLPDGAYSVSAQAPSTLEGLRSQIVAVAGEPTIAPDLAFTPVGHLSGRVSLQGLASPALRGVRIQVSGVAQAVYTEADGSFTVRGVTTGLHDVTASMPGFETQVASAVTVTYGQLLPVPELALADVNECASNNGGCDPNATCGNTPGSRTCSCNSGFQGSGLFCQDVDECLVNNGGCDASARCQNTPGSRTCSCKTGFTGNGLTCTDVNECQTNNGGCSANAVCGNTQGSRTCTCKTGFGGDGESCTDVNECLVNNGGCSLDAVCQNTQGSRTCSCKTGFTGDGLACTDVNECLTNNGGCSSNATCTNTVGGRLCECLDGFDGNGLSCKPRWMSVAAGTQHSLGVREDGSLWAWGTNAQSTLGDGTNTARLSPVRLGGQGSTWLQAATNGTSSCAVKSDASLWCWGDNASGQVGDGTTTPRSTPSRVGVDNSWSTVAVGSSNACAIRHNGTLWCWGANASGQVGRGTTGGNETSPVQVGVEPWLKVSLHTSAACGIKVDGSLWCWGSLAGVGLSGNTSVPTRIGGASDFVQFALSSGNYLCALRGQPSGGTLWCQGSNGSGQLGTGNTTTQSALVQVGAESDWTAVDVGQLHTCARRANGTLWCWGSNADGQLGVGSTAPALSPVQVGSATDWKSVVNVGDRHSCAQKLDGSSWCWGSGQLIGIGLDLTKTTPTETSWSN